MNPTYLLALGTAVPPVKMPQAKMADFMAQILHLAPSEARKLKALYRHTAIEHRYSVLHDFEQIDTQFYLSGEAPFPSTAARMQIYEQEALPLAVAAVEDLRQNLRENGLTGELQGLTHLITVSCTGMYAPGLDIQLIEHYGLPTGIQRTAINFMGCYASFNALKVGHAICQSQPEARVLIVGVELCTLHLQKSALEDDLIANSLFGDGAGAVLLSARPQGQKNLCLSNFASSLLPQGKTEMAWHIHDAGFSMRLSTYVPHLLEGAIAPMIGQMLNQIGMALPAIDHYAIHPGGRKILEAIEKGLAISKEQNHLAYEVLRDYGNMSSVTILFVWKKLWEEIQTAQHQQHILSMAFGPGLAIEASLMQVFMPAQKAENARKQEKVAI